MRAVRRPSAVVLALAVTLGLVLGLGVAANGATTMNSGVPSTGFMAFDAMSAPTTTTMSKWFNVAGSQPKQDYTYRGIGVYIPVGIAGGDARADKTQKNLTASWVTTVRSQGWSILPIYVGLQAPNPCGAIRYRMYRDPGLAYGQGKAAADDAAAQMAKLGIADSPVYFDMEAYAGGCSDAIQAFVQGWSYELRAKGDIPGIYGSTGSTMKDVAARWGASASRCVVPDAIWAATESGKETTANISNVPATDWSSNQRVTQIKAGHNETHGGVTINIDSDYVAGPVVPPTATPSTATPITFTAPTVTPAGPCLPGPAVDVEASGSRGAVTVTWGAADGAGSTITGYQVTNTVTGQVTTLSATARSHTFTGLTNGTRYDFRVVAVNALGAAIGNTAGAVPGARPDRPARPRLTPKRGGKLVVRWSKPASNGARITGFRVYVNGRLHTVGGRASSLTVRRLKRGRYRVSVAAVNALGASANSPVARARVR